MDLEKHLSEIQEGLRTGRFLNEASVSQGIVLRLLQQLGWPTFDPRVVCPEYSIEGRRVDFALCHPPNRPAVFVEVKQVGGAEGADRQLFEYAFHQGVPMAVLTTGQEWHIYLPAEQGAYQERRVYKLDLLERDVEQSTHRLQRYLAYDNVCSGKALSAARDDYRNVAREREIHRTLPSAWNELLQEQDSLLVDLVADKVESLCGYKPDPDTVAAFVTAQRQPSHAAANESSSAPRARTARTQPTAATKPAPGSCGFTLQGREFQARFARDVLVGLMNEFSSRDPTFLDRFAARKHGRRRRYIARTRDELYPERPDLSMEHSVQLQSGWWVGVNYSKTQIRKILEMGCQVAGLQYGSDLIVRLD